MINLKDRTPVANGLNQLVHEHPDNPDLLIKTLRLDKAEQRWLRKAGGLRVKRRHGIYTGWFRELNEYLALRARMPGGHPPFLQQLHGFAETDLGLGMVVGKVKDRSGNLAPTLGQVVFRDGMTEETRRRVQELWDWLNGNNVNTNDLSKSNILCGWDEARGEHLVIIEGLGDHNLVPLSRFSRRLTIASNDRHFRHILRSLKRLDRHRTEQQQKQQN